MASHRAANLRCHRCKLALLPAIVCAVISPSDDMVGDVAMDTAPSVTRDVSQGVLAKIHANPMQDNRTKQHVFTACYKKIAWSEH